MCDQRSSETDFLDAPQKVREIDNPFPGRADLAITVSIFCVGEDDLTAQELTSLLNDDSIFRGRGSFD
jgi:hypothetical protein